jgi:hypothetical protein
MTMSTLDPMVWNGAWNGEAAKDLIVCQHGKHRIVRINLDDVDAATASIDPDAVVVLVAVVLQWNRFGLLNYGNATDPWATNGVALLPNGDLVSPITSFEDPRFEVFSAAEKVPNGVGSCIQYYTTDYLFGK